MHGSSGFYLSDKTPSTSRKWTLVESDSAAADESDIIQSVNKQAMRELRLISEVQVSSEERLELLDRERNIHQKNIIELKDKTERQETVIYQLLGGLFNQQEQTGILNSHIETLNGAYTSKDDPTYDSSKWEMWPTTRQGDLLESEVTAMSKSIEELIRNQREQEIKFLDHIAKLEARVGRQDAIIMNFINGLFGLEQEKTRQQYVDFLLGNVSDIKLVNTSKWDKSPTTRQGDLTERKMAVFEKNLAEIRARLEQPILESSTK
jgi:hypothetical protein